MPTLDTSTQQELLALLAPLLEREGDRRAVLALALGTDCAVLAQIEWGGAVEPFVLRMVATLAHHGETINLPRNRFPCWRAQALRRSR
jgi:hypothetical protein